MKSETLERQKKTIDISQCSVLLSVAPIEPSTGSRGSGRWCRLVHSSTSYSLPQPPSPLLALLSCAYLALVAGVEACW